MREKLLGECSHIYEYSTYNAETHHLICARQRRVGKAVQFAPPVITAVLGVLTAFGCLPAYGVVLTAISAIFSAFATVYNPLEEADTHLRAGKAFTILKHDARRLRDVYSPGMSDDALSASVKALDDRYNDLVTQSPPTTDREFQKARAKIQANLHEPDGPADRRHGVDTTAGPQQ